ncbi:methyltransferase domain-containing protein [Sneathiella marina]|uniref:Methyltransferase domain-containing protein n=1 Tax=Sneathiella marina TaxID=2950108 RepID=A0ABY4WCB3_9PROT|nr:methyltransferase domain-containing protein [Sneathiella marina]USG62884.1 methyltransferase domain-containing protein [Sneathiella marina]
MPVAHRLRNCRLETGVFLAGRQLMRPPAINMIKVKQQMGEAVQLQRQGLTDAAAEAYRKVLKIDSSIAPAHYNLALMLKNQGKSSAADKAFKAALKCDPDYALAYSAYARFLGERGRGREAVQCLSKAAQLQEYPAVTLQELADQIEFAGQTDLGNAGDKALVLCLGRTDVASDGMILNILARLRRQPILKKLLMPGISNSDLDTFLKDEKNLRKFSKVFSEPVIAACLAQIILPDPEIEQLVSVCCGSAGLLSILDDEGLAILALQRDLTEYIRDVPLVELGEEGLRGALLEALQAPLEPAKAAILLQEHQAVLENRPWTRELLVRQGIQKQREQELAAGFAGTSVVRDKISQAVQAQYEESPYPRWRGLRHGGDVTLPALVKRLFPRIGQKPVATKPNILIAGCGTGRHALRTAIRVQDANLTALDLSTMSLAYGARQAEEMGIEQITFRQADIAALPKDLGQFDLIECCGVLHHMADPVGAWAGLLAHLAHNGVMKIALYSEQARQDVVAVHEMVADHKKLTLADIRGLRQEIQTLELEHPASAVSRELDFYSLSGCRDFLFHQQEQRFDLPSLDNTLSELELEFMGFEFVASQPLIAYAQAYPEDPSAQNLVNWATVEKDNPDLFRGMYQFWCRRK